MEQERLDVFRRYIRTTMSREPRALRHLTFTWPPESDESETGMQVSIDARNPGAVVLSIRTDSLSTAGERELVARGFHPTQDDDARFTSYSRTVASATVDDVATFVEWSMLGVLDAPADYVPGIHAISREAGAGGRRGCVGSCMTALRVIILVLAAIAALIWFFS